MHYGRALREAIERNGITIAPGVYDPLSAMVAENVGFSVVSITGNGTSVAKLGEPDVGVISLPEMAENARNVQDAIDVPVIADADDGFGNAINVRRTVKEFIRAGVGGIHIEDQVFPKRCGFVAGKAVIPRSEAIGKFEAAAAVRDRLDEDFVLIARTDARGVAGGTLEDAIDRVVAYCAAGADVAFVHGPAGQVELEEVAAAVDAPLIYLCGGGEPPMDLDAAGDLGYAIAMFPRISLLPAITALYDSLSALQTDGIGALAAAQRNFESLPVESYDTFSGVDRVRSLEERYLPDE